MTKIIGSLLVMAGCSFAGFLLVRRLSYRIRLLSELLAVLHTLRAEIGALHAPLPELLLSLERDHPVLAPLWKACITGWKPWQGQPLADCWAKGLDALDLRPQERRILMEAGQLLGKYDAQRQCEGLETAARQLELSLAAAQDERTRHGKVLGGLGVISGLMAVILLF